MFTVTFFDITAFYIGTILVAASSMVYTLIQRHTNKMQNKIYVVMLLILFVQAVQKIMIRYSMQYAVSDLFFANMVKVLTFTYFMLHTMLPLSLFNYSLFCSRVIIKLDRVLYPVTLIPFVVGEILVIANPYIGCMYTFDSTYEMVWNSGIYIGYALGLLYLLGAAFVFFRWGNSISYERKLIMIFAFSLTLIGVAVKTADHDADVELFSESLSFLGLMLAVEYDGERVDAATKLYNRIAFLQDVKTLSDLKTTFYVMSIHFGNIELVRRFLGITDSEQMQRMSATFRRIYDRDMIYRITPTVFAIIVPYGHKTKIMKLAKEIQGVFESDWTEKGSEFPLRSCVLYARYPDELSDTDDAMLLCDSVLEDEDYGKILSGDDLGFIFYRADLETALHTGLSEHRFEMKYLPIFSGRTYQMYAVESILVLHDPLLGEVSYNDFCDLVEKNGMIDRLGEYMLREACEFMQSAEARNNGIRYINVYLSLRQCLEPGFVDRANAIVAGCGIYPGMINFILQNAVEMEYHAILGRVITELKTLGFKISLDGYGNAFSTMYTVFSLEFDLIRMRFNEVLTGKKEEEATLEEVNDNSASDDDGDAGRWVIIENSIKLIHNLNRQVIVTGVENRKQLERLRSFSVDYVEGPYLSEPKTKEELARRNY